MKRNVEMAKPARQSFITIIDTFDNIEECANEIIVIPDVKHVELIYNDSIKRWQMKAVANGNKCDKS